MATEAGQAQELEAELDERDRALLDKLADGIARWRMITPAMFFLESVKPMNFIGSSAMVFFRPLISVMWTEPASYDRLSALLERRGSIELLLRRLEERA